MEFEKWRETCDPFALPLKDFRIGKILGYPHAGNDVFHVTGEYMGEPVRAYIKVARQRGSDILREVDIISKAHIGFAPEILEFLSGPPAALVTREMSGERLSFILSGSPAERSMDYMEKYGAALADIHGLCIDAAPVADRKFFHVPEDCPKDFKSFLNGEIPTDSSKCFVHGDFHYANILWQDREISAVLDWELSGIGIREFDLAWAVVLRPEQRFMDTWEEIESFLTGYGAGFSLDAFLYYYVLVAAWFWHIGDGHYREKLRRLMDTAIKIRAGL